MKQEPSEPQTEYAVFEDLMRYGMPVEQLDAIIGGHESKGLPVSREEAMRIFLILRRLSYRIRYASQELQFSAQCCSPEESAAGKHITYQGRADERMQSDIRQLQDDVLYHAKHPSAHTHYLTELGPPGIPLCGRNDGGLVWYDINGVTCPQCRHLCDPTL